MVNIVNIVLVESVGRWQSAKESAYRCVVQPDVLAGHFTLKAGANEK